MGATEAACQLVSCILLPCIDAEITSMTIASILLNTFDTYSEHIAIDLIHEDVLLSIVSRTDAVSFSVSHTDDVPFEHGIGYDIHLFLLREFSELLYRHTTHASSDNNRRESERLAVEFCPALFYNRWCLHGLVPVFRACSLCERMLE